MKGNERQEELANVLNVANDAVQQTAQDLRDRPDRREVVKLAVLIAVIVSLIMGGIAIFVATAALSSAARTAADNAAGQQAATRDADNNRKLAQQAYDSAKAANDALAARGQPQVPVAPPNTNDPTATIVAAATARVLAALPPQPTAADVAQQIARDQLLQPPSVPVTAIAGQVASYLAQNPPPSGPPGPSGQPGTNGQNGTNGQDGKTPTEADIQSAFVDYVNANPGFLFDQLCKDHGSPSSAQNLVAQDGTTYTVYGCIVSSSPPTSPTSPTPPSGVLPTS
jgi:hypothetical protein